MPKGKKLPKIELFKKALLRPLLRGTARRVGRPTTYEITTKAVNQLDERIFKIGKEAVMRYTLGRELDAFGKIAKKYNIPKEKVKAEHERAMMKLRDEFFKEIAKKKK